MQGKVPASNLVEILSPHSQNKSLGLVGKYLYVCYKVLREKIASIHFDFIMQDGNPLRLTLTTLTANPKDKTDSNPLLPLEASGKWTIYVIDLDYTFKELKAYPKTNLFRKYKHELATITLCSDSFVRGIYTSDNLYHIEVGQSLNQVMPKEINFRKPKSGTWEENYLIRYFPVSKAKESLKYVAHFQSEAEHTRRTFVDQKVTKLSAFKENHLQESPQHPETYTELERAAIFKENQEQENPQLGGPQSSLIRPNPILKLERVVGFTGRTCPDIRFSKIEPDRLYYATGNTIVTTKLDSFNQQEFLQGHKAAVTCMELSYDGKILASCEEGENPMLRIWRTDNHQCVGKFNVGVAEARCISFSCQSYTMCVIGTDKLFRDEILIIDAHTKEDGRSVGAKIIARQISEFNILTIKFSPIDADRLVSCGKENIRFWRIKNQHLPGGAVVLNHHARDTIFTVFDFDFGKADQPRLAARDDVVKRVLVGSKHGFLYQVNYDTRQLESVVKIHDLSICSISVSAGFCVTGSQDQYIRVWPLDFSEFFLEAQHESIIIALDVSLDGLKVACGTSANSLSILDLTTQNYKTLLRSHSDTITSLRSQEENHILVSLSKDSSIRIWDDYNLDQIYEFNYTKEDECNCIDVHPTRNIFVGGFSSGVVRVFSIERVEVLSEHKYHNQAIEDIKFSASGRYIGLGDTKGFYTILDSDNKMEFVKTFESKPNSYLRRAQQQQNLLRFYS